MPRVTHPDLEAPAMVTDEQFQRLKSADARWSAVGPAAAGLEGIGEQALIGGEWSQRGATIASRPGGGFASPAPKAAPVAAPPEEGMDDYEAAYARALAGTQPEVIDVPEAPPERTWLDEAADIGRAAMGGITRGGTLGLLSPGMLGDIDDMIAKDMKEAGLGDYVFWDEGQGDYARRMEEEHPVVGIGAEALTALHPASLGARALSGAGRLAAGLGGKVGRAAGAIGASKSLPATALRSVAGAGLEGTVAGAAQPVQEAFAPGAENPTLGDIGESAALGGLSGAAFGGLFAPAEFMAGKAVKALREKPGLGPELRRAESGGMTTHWLSGIQNPPWALRDDAIAREATELEALIEEGALRVQDTLEQMHRSQDAAYAATPQGQALHRPGTLIEAVRQKIQGKPGAFASAPSKAWSTIRERLRDPGLIYKHLSDAEELASQGNAKGLVRAEEARMRAAEVLRDNDIYIHIPGTPLPPGAVTVDASKLLDMGISADDVDAAIEATVQHPGIPEDLHHYAGLLGAKLKAQMTHMVDPRAGTQLSPMPATGTMSTSPAAIGADGPATAPGGRPAAAADATAPGGRQAQRDIATSPGGRDSVTRVEDNPPMLDEGGMRRLRRQARLMETERFGREAARRANAPGAEVVTPWPYLQGRHPAEIVVVPQARPLEALEADIADLGERAKVATAQKVAPEAQDFRDVYGVAQDLRRTYAPHPDIAPAEPRVNIPGAEPAGGYRGMKARQGMQRRELESRQAEVGLPEERLKAQYSDEGDAVRRIDMPTRQRRGVTGAITDFNLQDANQVAAADEALRMFLEASGGDVERMKKLGASIASGRLRNLKDPKFKAIANSSAAIYATNFWDALQLRLDPSMRHLSGGTAPAAVGVAAGAHQDNALTRYFAEQLRKLGIGEEEDNARQ